MRRSWASIIVFWGFGAFMAAGHVVNLLRHNFWRGLDVTAGVAAVCILCGWIAWRGREKAAWGVATMTYAGFLAVASLAYSLSSPQERAAVDACVHHGECESSHE